MKIKSVIIVFYTLALWIESAIPDTGSGSFQLMPASANNFFHAPAYGLLAWFILSFLDTARSSRNNVFLCIAAAFLIGLVAEVIQFFTPGRFATLFDIGLNLVGILLAVAIYRRYRHHLQSR